MKKGKKERGLRVTRAYYGYSIRRRGTFWSFISPLTVSEDLAKGPKFRRGGHVVRVKDFRTVVVRFIYFRVFWNIHDHK